MKNVISVTSRALNQLLKIKTEYNSKYIHFGVKSGGCSGFQYVLGGFKRVWVVVNRFWVVFNRWYVFFNCC